jgi:hypothetical protein
MFGGYNIDKHRFCDMNLYMVCVMVPFFGLRKNQKLKGTRSHEAVSDNNPYIMYIYGVPL